MVVLGISGYREIRFNSPVVKDEAIALLHSSSNVSDRINRCLSRRMLQEASF